MKGKLLLAGAVLVFGICNLMILEKESLLARGHVMLLRTLPYDPRSLMQGDYMQLRYELCDGPAELATRDGPRTGQLVVRLDEHRVAAYLRVHEGGELARGEQLLRYRRVQHGLRVGAETFFFQEGHADQYRQAAFAEFKVDEDGSTVLVGLRGRDFERLGPQK
ncbi:MAG: GDYXXLXY domain-containing protein [Planctomycetota bacterium]